jgi:ABC-type multidrug transport system fused ATPase/permease subunit
MTQLRIHADRESKQNAGGFVVTGPHATITIAHRRATMERADRIVVRGRGRLRDLGERV